MKKRVNLPKKVNQALDSMIIPNEILEGLSIVHLELLDKKLTKTFNELSSQVNKKLKSLVNNSPLKNYPTKLGLKVYNNVYSLMKITNINLKNETVSVNLITAVIDEEDNLSEYTNNTIQYSWQNFNHLYKTHLPIDEQEYRLRLVRIYGGLLFTKDSIADYLKL